MFVMGPPESQLPIPNDILIGADVFAQLTAESLYTLQWAAFPSKLPLLMGDRHPYMVLWADYGRPME